MRLICPNCGAQYEVDDSVIPEGGRDVQCSNCGHTWFQRPANRDRELADEMGLELPEEQDDVADEAEEQEKAAKDTEVVAEAAAGTDAEHLPEDEFKDASEEESDHLPEDEFEDEPEEPALTRRELDPAVAGILREEAEREAAERAEEGVGLETQPDLGLESGEDSEAARERMARLRGLPDDEEESDQEEVAVAAVVAASARRDLLPDIEEINSTLTASSDRDEEDDEDREEKRQRSGFRRGFILAVVFFVVLALIYSYAPRIVQSYPQTEPALSAYVDLVNALRQWVDGILQKAVEKLTVVLSQLGGGEG